MRLYEINPLDVVSTVMRPICIGADDRGNPRLVGLDREGRAIIVVIAKDDAEFVITAFPEG